MTAAIDEQIMYDHILYAACVQKMANLHPAYWDGASWEIGTEKKADIVKLKGPTGSMPFQFQFESGKPHEFFGFPVRFVEGHVIRLLGTPRACSDCLGHGCGKCRQTGEVPGQISE
jgi:hypothetical protein